MVVGFCGPGHASKAVTRRLIEFFYPADTLVVLPANPEHPVDPEVDEAFKEIFADKWDAIDWQTNVVDILREERACLGRDVELVVAWDESVDQDTRDMVCQARAENIPVKNLCRGLYDLTEDAEDPPGGAVVAAEPVKPVSHYRATPEAPKPAEEITGPREVTMVFSVATAHRLIEMFDGAGTQFGRDMADFFRENLGVEVKQHPGTTVHKETNRTQIQEVPVADKTRTYIQNEDGTWRLAGRGRPRNDQNRRKLTDEEARAEGIIE